MDNLPQNFSFGNDQSFGWSEKINQRRSEHLATLNRGNKSRWKGKKKLLPVQVDNLAPMRNPPQAARFVPLEEHFENFTDVVGDVVENIAGEDFADFLGLGKKAQRRKDARREVKNKKKLAKADLIQAKADAVRIAAQGEADAARLAAQQQTAQTNQIAASTGNAPAQLQESPMYQTFPDTAGRNTGNWADDNSQAETPQTASTTPAKNNNKTMIYIIIAVVVIAGIIFFMRKKK